MVGFNIMRAAVSDSRAVEVWPENWPAVSMFCEINTQWRASGGARYGLDYSVLFRRLDDLCDGRDEWEWMYQDIRVMERAALEAMREE